MIFIVISLKKFERSLLCAGYNQMQFVFSVCMGSITEIYAYESLLAGRFA